MESLNKHEKLLLTHECAMPTLHVAAFLTVYIQCKLVNSNTYKKNNMGIKRTAVLTHKSLFYHPA